jgi:hypothetical protein
VSHVWANGDIRPDAFFFLHKDEDGKLSGMEGGHLEDATDAAAVNAVLGALASRAVSAGRDGAKARAAAALEASAEGDFGLSADDMRGVAERVPAGHTAIVILFENMWERKLRDAVGSYGGSIVRQSLVTPEVLAETASKLAHD